MQPKVPKRPGAKTASQATRAKRRKAEQFADQADLCRMLPCCACRTLTRQIVRSVLIARSVGWYGPESRVSDPHHEPPISQGGKDRDTVPLCTRHHRQRHDLGHAPFELKHAVRLEPTAAMIAAVRDEQRGGQ